MKRLNLRITGKRKNPSQRYKIIEDNFPNVTKEVPKEILKQNGQGNDSACLTASGTPANHSQGSKFQNGVARAPRLILPAKAGILLQAGEHPIHRIVCKTYRG